MMLRQVRKIAESSELFQESIDEELSQDDLEEVGNCLADALASLYKAINCLDCARKTVSGPVKQAEYNAAAEEIQTAIDFYHDAIIACGKVRWHNDVTTMITGHCSYHINCLNNV